MNNSNPQPPGQGGQQSNFYQNPGSLAYYPTAPDAVPEIKPRTRSILPPAIDQVLQTFSPHVLSRAEVRDIKKDTGRRIESILALEAQIAQLGPNRDQRIEDRLVYERADLAVRYFRIFKINEMPPEILANIFRFVVWAVGSPQEGVNARLGVTHVCRYWRQVAVMDTTLWSAVWFRDQHPYTRSWTFLDRAQQTMLDIRINDTPQNPMTDDQARVFMDRLVPKLSHTRMLIMLFQDWEPILTIMKRLYQAGRSGQPISLERFELHRSSKPFLWPGASFQPVGHQRTSYPLFGGARLPNLTFFSANAVTFDWEKSVLSNLTTLDLRRIPIELSPNVDLFRRILQTSLHLEKLSLDGAGPSCQPSYRNIQGKIILGNLHTLVVANFTLQYASQIFSHIAAPNLNDLTLMNFMGDYTQLWATLRGEFPRVRILTLYGVTCTVSPVGLRTFINFLSSMPDVAYLRMASVGLDVLQAFLYDTETYQIDPKFTTGLTSFFRMIPLHDPHTPGTKQPVKVAIPRVAAVEVESLDVECLRRFVAARIVSGAPIYKIYIAGPMPNFSLEGLGTLTKVVAVSMMQPGARTPEELVLSDLTNRR